MGQTITGRQVLGILRASEVKRKRNEMVDKMITKYGFEDIKTKKFAETAEHMEFSDEHVQTVFNALYGEE